MHKAFVEVRDLLLNTPIGAQTSATFAALCTCFEPALGAGGSGVATLIDYAHGHLAQWHQAIARPLPLSWIEAVDSDHAPSELLRLANTLHLTPKLLPLEELPKTLLALCKRTDLAHITQVVVADVVLNKAWVAGLSHAFFATTLHRLELPYCEIGDSGLQALTRSPKLGGALHTLDLRYNRIGRSFQDELAQAEHLNGLRILRLHGNHVDQIEALANATHLSTLEELDLRYNPIGPFGAEALAQSPYLGGLKRLYLHTTDIGGPPGIRALASSPHLNHTIRRLWRARL
ncbi:MAG: hypothetical protein AAFX99_17360 [Myxococcota bacterium]